MSERGVSAGRRLVRIGVQVVGLAAGIASLWWCVSMALRPENREQLERLGEAPARLIAAMAALSLGTLLTNGLTFWVTIRPVRRLRAADVLATNALCTLLGYLPLKAGAIVRVIIHNRRDRVPVLTIGAWFGALIVTLGLAMAPPIAITLRLGRIDGAWWALVLGAMMIGGALVVAVARVFRGEAGRARLVRLAAWLPPARRFLETTLWSQMHAAFDMLASPWSVAGAVLLRFADLGIHAARFLVAAAILGVALPTAEAVPIAITYFLVGVVSPSGLAGLREGAATGLAGVLVSKAGATKETMQAFAAVSLLVTAVEAAAFLAGGAIGLAWLRPDRVIRLRGTNNGEGEGGSAGGK